MVVWSPDWSAQTLTFQHSAKIMPNLAYCSSVVCIYIKTKNDLHALKGKRGVNILEGFHVCVVWNLIQAFSRAVFVKIFTINYSNWLTENCAVKPIIYIFTPHRCSSLMGCGVCLSSVSCLLKLLARLQGRRASMTWAARLKTASQTI